MWKQAEKSGFNEAPIHESGKFAVLVNDLFGQRASMRPRFMNRGSSTFASDLRTCASRFNEAPIHESGKCRRLRGRRSPRRRFNEAPIHESGKCRDPERQCHRLLGFNEAPIHESGKLDRATT